MVAAVPEAQAGVVQELVAEVELLEQDILGTVSNLRLLACRLVCIPLVPVVGKHLISLVQVFRGGIGIIHRSCIGLIKL